MYIYIYIYIYIHYSVNSFWHGFVFIRIRITFHSCNLLVIFVTTFPHNYRITGKKTRIIFYVWTALSLRLKGAIHSQLN